MSTALTLGFALLALLVVLALVWSHWPVWLRTLLVIAVTGFYFWADDAVHGAWGWPSADALPERFVLLAAVIDEPAKSHEGALYVWVNAIEDGKPQAQPRAYRLPYSKDLHALLNEGLKKARQGITQMGTTEPRTGGKRPFLSWLRAGADDQVVKIRDLPAPQLPEK
ncbi:MAG: hypothetical protein KGQ77_08970 [Betaproteobacteria bacterium]|nr:hypothetical protein [Betaproteobacteria bacterium]